MILTKLGHSCVRLRKDEQGPTLVIDPGVFTEADAALGADAILITHEHTDHYAEQSVRAAMDANPAAHVWTLKSVAEQLSSAYPGRVHTVGNGDSFTAAGLDIQVHGELHAVIHPDIPRITNVGYLVEGDLFHPGDALTVPDHVVETLMVPVNAPWSKASEVIDYVREVKPVRTISIHDALLAETGVALYGRVVGGLIGTEYERLDPGASQTL
jgi:L-ascorbate metabolism protein UlaG (beta-lactamase superfamily)